MDKEDHYRSEMGNETLFGKGEGSAHLGAWVSMYILLTIHDMAQLKKKSM